MSDDIVQRLRDACPATQDFTHTTQGALMDEAADHIEQLTAERDRLRVALERIAGVKGPYSHPFPESNEGYGSFAIVTAREALKGETP